MSYPGAIAPPAGEQADLNNPQDVLRTINYVTQVLTLVLVTLFVALRLFVKFHVYKGRWTADDCEYISNKIFLFGVSSAYRESRFNMLCLCMNHIQRPYLV